MEYYQLFLTVIAGTSVALFLILRKIYGPILERHYTKPRRQRLKGKGKGKKKSKARPKKKGKAAQRAVHDSSSSDTESPGIRSPSPIPAPPPTPISPPMSQSASSDNSLNQVDFSVLEPTLTRRLNIRPGLHRARTIALVIEHVIFTCGVARFLPFRGSAANRLRCAREAATVFLIRYGALIWPAEPQPAPHLLTRELWHPRDSTLSEEARERCRAMGGRAPARESGLAVAMSELGVRLTEFVEEVMVLPRESWAGVEWGLVGLVLDRPGIGEGEARERMEELPWGLMGQIEGRM